jgi:hypothetical protein
MQVHVYHQLQKRHYQAALHHERMWVPTLKLLITSSTMEHLATLNLIRSTPCKVYFCHKNPDIQYIQVESQSLQLTHGYRYANK